jgi:hypothetical protein
VVLGPQPKQRFCGAKRSWRLVCGLMLMAREYFGVGQEKDALESVERRSGAARKVRDDAVRSDQPTVV